jgi:hypothetical protein
VRIYSRPGVDDDAKTIWLTLAIMVAAGTIVGIVAWAWNHWLAFLAIVAVVLAALASVPFWVWISASILFGAYWIARAIKNHP